MYCEGTRKVFRSSGGEAPGLCFEMQFYSSALMSHGALIDTGAEHEASGKKGKKLTRAHFHVHTSLFFSSDLIEKGEAGELVTCTVIQLYWVTCNFCCYVTVWKKDVLYAVLQTANVSQFWVPLFVIFLFSCDSCTAAKAGRNSS